MYVGELIVESTLTFPIYVKHISRSFRKKDQGIHVEITAGPLQQDHELVLRINTTIQNHREFYTDANGLEMQHRLFREDTPQPVAGNYYPIVYSIYLNDTKNYLTIISDRTIAGASLRNGELELLIHRRTSYDDARGVDEPLDDDTVLKSNLRVFVDQSSEEASRHRHLHSYLVNFPLEVYQLPSNFDQPFLKSFSPLKRDFPNNVNVMTFSQSSKDSKNVLLRLNHLYELNEHKEFSKPAIFDLKDHFKSTITSVRGKSLRNLDDRNIFNLIQLDGQLSTKIHLDSIEMKAFEINFAK
jgi:hypothetical protein